MFFFVIITECTTVSAHFGDNTSIFLPLEITIYDYNRCSPFIINEALGFFLGNYIHPSLSPGGLTNTIIGMFLGRSISVNLTGSSLLLILFTGLKASFFSTPALCSHPPTPHFSHAEIHSNALGQGLCLCRIHYFIFFII